MKIAFPLLALAALSSAAQAKTTELMCTDERDHRAWLIDLDEGDGVIGTATVNGDTRSQRRAAFAPAFVRIDWAVGLTMEIDRTTLRYHLFEFGAPPTSLGTCTIKVIDPKF